MAEQHQGDKGKRFLKLLNDKLDVYKKYREIYLNPRDFFELSTMINQPVSRDGRGPLFVMNGQILRPGPNRYSEDITDSPVYTNMEEYPSSSREYGYSQWMAACEVPPASSVGPPTIPEVKPEFKNINQGELMAAVEGFMNACTLPGNAAYTLLIKDFAVQNLVNAIAGMIQRNTP